MSKKFLPILLLSLALSACGQGNSNSDVATTSTAESKETSTPVVTTATDSLQFKTYSGEGVSFDYPSTWSEYDVSNYNQPTIKASFVDPAPKVQFADNINITVQDGVTTAKVAADSAVAYYKQDTTNMKDFKTKTYESSPNFNNTAGILEVEYTQPQSGVVVVLTQYIVPQNQKLYTVSLSLSKDSYYSIGKETVDQMVNSLKIDAVSQANTPASSVTQNTKTADAISNIIPNLVENEHLDEKTYQYIVEHHELFPAVTPATKNAAKAAVNSKITTRHLFKNITPYLNKMVKVSGEVVQVQEEETDIGTIANVHIMDDNGNSIIGIYMGSTGDILDGDRVTLRGVPSLSYSFQNVGGGTTLAIMLTVSTIQKN